MKIHIITAQMFEYSTSFKVPFNGKARGYRPKSHMYLISLNFRGFSPEVFGCSRAIFWMSIKITWLFGL